MEGVIFTRIMDILGTKAQRLMEGTRHNQGMEQRPKGFSEGQGTEERCESWDLPA